MGSNTTLATASGDILERLLAARPDRRDALRPYVQKVKALRNECGCAMSGAFLTGAIGLVIVRHLFLPHIFPMSLVGEVLAAAAFVIGAGMIGKAMGIAVARLRLALLYRGLRNRYRGEGV
jgi:hypothetical protein